MKILIIEDEVELAESMKQGLEGKGFIVETKNTGEGGFERGVTGEFDSIVLDLNLPDIDGLEVCRRLRENNIDTPIIMLTARTSIDNRIEGLDSGSDDYMPKPFEIDELRARIQALIRRYHGRTKKVLEVSGIELDPSNRLVKYSGQEVPVTAKEFDILEYLLEKYPGYATADEIINHIWHEDSSQYSNVVKVHIANTRRKLKKISGENLIESSKGIGYRICKE